MQESFPTDSPNVDNSEGVPTRSGEEGATENANSEKHKRTKIGTGAAAGALIAAVLSTDPASATENRHHVTDNESDGYSTVEAGQKEGSAENTLAYEVYTQATDAITRAARAVGHTGSVDMSVDDPETIYFAAKDVLDSANDSLSDKTKDLARQHDLPDEVVDKLAKIRKDFVDEKLSDDAQQALKDMVNIVNVIARALGKPELEK